MYSPVVVLPEVLDRFTLMVCVKLIQLYTPSCCGPLGNLFPCRFLIYIYIWKRTCKHAKASSYLSNAMIFITKKIPSNIFTSSKHCQSHQLFPLSLQTPCQDYKVQAPDLQNTEKQALVLISKVKAEAQRKIIDFPPCLV